jgi:hypothetical protein
VLQAAVFVQLLVDDPRFFWGAQPSPEGFCAVHAAGMCEN